MLMWSYLTLGVVRFVESLTRQTASWTALPLVQGDAQGSTMERAYLFEDDAQEEASQKQVECHHLRPSTVGFVFTDFDPQKKGDGVVRQYGDG